MNDTRLPPNRLAKLANALGVSTPIPHAHESRTQRPANPTSRFLLHVVPPRILHHTNPALPPPNAPGYHTQFRRGTLVPVHPTLHAQLAAIAREYALPSTVGLVLYLVSLTPLDDDAPDEPGPRLSEDIWRHLWTRVLRVEQRDDHLSPTPGSSSSSLLLPSRSPTPHSFRSPQLLTLAGASRSTPFLPQESTSPSSNPITSPLRPFLASSEPEPFTPTPIPRPSTTTPTAPSTPSDVSDVRSAHNKSAPPSTTSEFDTPDTSIEDVAAHRANSFDLPGLTSPSLIPILAKVEFDIDRQKAAWYDPWVRSRRINHAKRTGVKKKRSKAQPESPDDAQSEELAKTEAKGKKSRQAPLELLTGKKGARTPIEADLDEEDEPDLQEEGPYATLEDEEDEFDDDFDQDDATARVASTVIAGGKDPLADVFGSDADTWADIRASSRHLSSSERNPNIVPLALTAHDLSSLPPPDEDSVHLPGEITREETEVQELLDRMSSSSTSLSKSDSTPRKVPPPLVLVPKDIAALGNTTVVSGSSPLSSPYTLTAKTGLASPGLAYLSGGSSGEEDAVKRGRSPSLSEKRVGAVFDDLDLGLDDTEDYDDPNDRRRSQLLMKAQLDEIERTMASLSPRFMKTELDEELNLSFNSATLSPNASSNLTLSPGGLRSPLSLSPRLPKHPEPLDNTEEYEPSLSAQGQAWPAVPFSSIKADPAAGSARETPTSSTFPNADSGSGSSLAPPPPQLAVNGVTTSAPKMYAPTRSLPSGGPSESERRKKDLEEEELALNGGGDSVPQESNPSAGGPPGNSRAPYTPIHPPLSLQPGHPTQPPPPMGGSDLGGLASPIIPLSPDPFGRYPSDAPPLGDEFSPTDSATPLANQTRTRSSTTSRFSVDSVITEEPSSMSNNNSNASGSGAAPKANRTTLMSVKGFKNLWRKSTKNNTSSAPMPPPPPTPTLPPSASGRSSPMIMGSAAVNAAGGAQGQGQGQGVQNAPAPGNGRPSLSSPPMGAGQAPMRPERPSQDRLLELPDVPVPPPPASFQGRLSPQPGMGMGGAPPHGPTSIPNEAMPPLSQMVPRRSMDQQQPPPSSSPPPGTQGYPGPPRPSLDQQVNYQMGLGVPPPGRTPSPSAGPPYPNNPHQNQNQNIPYPNLRNAPGPIVTPHMRPGGSGASTLDRFHFDQESPYPTSIRKTSPKPPSPSPPPMMYMQQQPIHHQPPPPPQQQPRKSILKWKSSPSQSSHSTHASVSSHVSSSSVASLSYSNAASSSATSFATTVSSSLPASSVLSFSPSPYSSAPIEPTPTSRTSFERPRAGSTSARGGGSGGRRPSVINFGSSSSSPPQHSRMTSPVQDMPPPPSPQIPQQFMNQMRNDNNNSGGAGLDYRSSQRSRLTVSSNHSGNSGAPSSPPQRSDSLHAHSGGGGGYYGGNSNLRSSSPPRSMASRSSRDSGGSRPSFDVSQFEFVSPPRGVAVNYPYGGDHGDER